MAIFTLPFSKKHCQPVWFDSSIFPAHFFFFCTLKRALSAAHLYPRRKIALQRNPFHCIRNGVSQLTSSLTQSIGQTINYLLFTHPSRLTCNIFTTLFFARKLRQSEKEKCSKWIQLQFALRFRYEIEMKCWPAAPKTAIAHFYPWNTRITSFI